MWVVFPIFFLCFKSSSCNSPLHFYCPPRVTIKEYLILAASMRGGGERSCRNDAVMKRDLGTIRIDGIVQGEDEGVNLDGEETLRDVSYVVHS